jgi:hypothetical protein
MEPVETFRLFGIHRDRDEALALDEKNYRVGHFDG